MNAQKYLVTGAAGWLGSRLVEILVNQGHHVQCLKLPGEQSKLLDSLKDKITVFEGDIRNPSDCDAFCSNAKSSVLIHTAGIIHPKKVSDFYQINVQGTKNLVESAENGCIKRMVIVSSNSPLGNNPHPDHLFDEKSPYHPYMNYGRSKMLMEQFIINRQKKSKMDYVLIRAPWFYGTNQPPRQSLFFSMIRKGGFPILGSGKNLRSMVFIDNLCQGLILASVKNEASNQIFWIADKSPYSMNEIIGTVSDLLSDEFKLHCEKKQINLPGFIGELATLIDYILQSMGIYNQKFHVLSEMNKTIACSIEKAEKILGYHPEFELKEGMRRSIKWCLDNKVKI